MKSLPVMLRGWSVVIINIWIVGSCLGDGNVGCLFSESLCNEEEFCYDDYAFGRCLPLHGPIEKEAFFRFDLLHPDLRTLQKEMDHLFRQGYRWSHTYTQCVMQAMLESIQMGEDDFDRSVCSSMMDQDLEAALKAIEGDEQEQLDQRNLAYVQFTPSASNPHPEFADEVYFPPLTEEDEDDMRLNMVEVDPSAPIQGYYPYQGVKLRKRRIPQQELQQPSASSLLLQKLMNRPHLFHTNYNTPDAFRQGQESRDENSIVDGHFFHNYNTPEGFREGHESRDQQLQPQENYRGSIYGDDENIFLNPELPPGAVPPEEFSQMYGNDEDEFDDENEIPSQYYAPPQKQPRLPDEFRAQGPSRPSMLTPELRHVASLMYQSGDEPREQDRVEGGYTEGGLIFLPENPEENLVDERVGEEQLDTTELDDGLDALLAEYDTLDWGFKRRERLDVKKPGPPFSTNNYAFRDHKFEGGDTEAKMDNDNASNQIQPEVTESWIVPNDSESFDDVEVSPLTSPENNKPDITKEYIPNIPHMLPQKKELPKPESTDGTSVSDQYDIVDTTYAYIGFKNGIHKWVDGTRIVSEVARLLDVEPEAFTKPNVHRNEVAFKVEPNSKGLNASEVAKRIDSIKGELKKRLGIEVTSAGIGNKTKLPSVLVAPDSQHELYIATFLLCGAVAAVLVAATALYVIRRHARSREKLQNLSAPDTEASKDYQDLCRARMANKAQQEKPEPIHVGQTRIASLSRESEGSNNSPSSRSSTSSWSEEPALTNMDISTGHMVLSYMEDHLKNKDRLEQEWVALCAYEAEPCSTTVAQKPENSKKNRYAEFLPYDHSRVVLNDLANISGSDYINASTITDHDPRNPAYIATQGPLPHTSPDFWQMIWEQGSVVMVMLTRLTEGGTAMCHRYWPEEGSELYHIYEVHLVSEHIWCDDYLVRSFYLKNLKTGETRTVTQFHFLSWPDGGVPLSTKALLEFRRKVNKSYRGRSCPIVVHCSDGVGRTGTYCLIDMVLNRMAKGAKEIDIAATLEHIRDQRQAMVRTKQQFEFVLMAVAEEVHAILKALPSQQQPQPQQQQHQQQQQQQQQQQPPPPQQQQQQQPQQPQQKAQPQK